LIGANGAGKSNFVSLFKMLNAEVMGNLPSFVARQGSFERILYMGEKVTPVAQVDFITATEKIRIQIDTGSSVGTGFVGKPTSQKADWGVYHFHDTSETAHMKKPCGLNDNIELASDGRNIAAYLYRLQKKEQQSYQRIVRMIQRVAPFFDNFVLRPNPLNEEMIQMEWKRTDSDIPFLASQLSDGTLRFICLATLLLQPSHLAPDTIIIDEPELGLHPDAISLLGELIKSASFEKQIILSTQSVDLLNEFDVENVIVVDHIDNASTFRRLSTEELKAWLEDDYSLGTLWCKNLLGGGPS
jgi:predicted ATPase